MSAARVKSVAALWAFVVLAVAPFAYAATRSWFWQHKHSMAPVATAAYLLVVAALVVGRYRWAWLLLALFYGGSVVGWVFDAHRFETRTVLFEAEGVATLALLFVPSMRNRLRRPVTLRPVARKPQLQER